MRSFVTAILFALLVIPVLMGVACQDRSDENPEALQAIALSDNDFMQAISNGDPHAIAGLYTIDANILPPNEKIIRGQGNIGEYWAVMIEMGVNRLDLETLEAHSFGEYAYQVGKYKIFTGDDQELETGKFIAIWQKSGDTWKMYRDIWKSSVPVHP
jgi:ketosteroid isomerase-like protein